MARGGRRPLHRHHRRLRYPRPEERQPQHGAVPLHDHRQEHHDRRDPGQLGRRRRPSPGLRLRRHRRPQRRGPRPRERGQGPANPLRHRHGHGPIADPLSRHRGPRRRERPDGIRRRRRLGGPPGPARQVRDQRPARAGQRRDRARGRGRPLRARQRRPSRRVHGLLQPMPQDLHGEDHGHHPPQGPHLVRAHVRPHRGLPATAHALQQHHG